MEASGGMALFMEESSRGIQMTWPLTSQNSSLASLLGLMIGKCLSSDFFFFFFFFLGGVCVITKLFLTFRSIRDEYSFDSLFSVAS